MARKLPVKSGKELLQTLKKANDVLRLTYKRTKGRHVILHNRFCRNFNVPLHNELKLGTLDGVIDNAGMTKEQFFEYDP